MGLYWGQVRSINKQGHLLGHIKVRRVAGQLGARDGSGRQREPRPVPQGPPWFALLSPSARSERLQQPCRWYGLACSSCMLLSQPGPQPPPCPLQDIGLDPNRPETRLYATSAAQPIHNVRAGPGRERGAAPEGRELAAGSWEAGTALARLQEWHCVKGGRLCSCTTP